jgi:hypothetical protein
MNGIEPYPAMPTPHQDRRDLHNWPRTSLTVVFQNPAHLADSIAYARDKGQYELLLASIGGIVALFRNDAAGLGEFSGGADGPEPPTPPKVVRLTFMPDSRVRPSFTWAAQDIPDRPGAAPRMLLHGGLIYRDHNGWSVHT